MANDSSLISQLRAKAIAERKVGDEYYARADTYDRAADQLEGKPVVVEATGRSLVKTNATAIGESVRRAGSKGKPAGSISKRWRLNFGSIYLIYGADFRIEDAIQVVKTLEGRDVRPSELRRLFQTNIEHGTLELLADDLYHMTAKLIAMVSEAMKHEGPPAQTGGPHVGGVAERFIASDSKSDGVTSEPSPVGSNPTTSAPSAGQPLFQRVVHFAQTPPND